MSWMQKLYETYEKAVETAEATGESPPLPPGHITQQVHIEIAIDAEGNFLRASMVGKEETLIPATESSASRTSGGAPHPLCDKIQYVAGDYKEYGGEKKTYFDDFETGKETREGYLTLLGKWSKASGNPKVNAVYRYVSKRSVVSDLIREKVLFVGSDGKLLASWPLADDEPLLFKSMVKKAGAIDQGDAMLRWLVDIPSEKENRVWKDEEVISSWIAYDASQNTQEGLCFVSGKEMTLSSLHPARVRHAADKAKLVSANDETGFTFRGRFIDATQACSVGFDTTQKAHSALRWLVGRQSFRNEDQVIVSWNTSCGKTPPLMENSADALLSDLALDGGLDGLSAGEQSIGDIGQAYAKKLSQKIAGYKQNLDDQSEIVVMALDSATPGRMSITFYRELKGSEFLECIEEWHKSYAWFQYYGKANRFIGAPAPKDIALAAYGRRIDNKLNKSTVSRILPCIVDLLPIPRDLERSVFLRAVNRVSMEYWEWENALGIACGLYKGLNKEMNYDMSLENERKTRDYLYGRLLAVAERTEQIALLRAGELRDTNAAKLMHRFSERPYSTWRQIELALIPYKSRLLGSRTAFLEKMNNLLDDIHNMFETVDFTNDLPLTGEFLLGYHCQRRDLKSKTIDAESEDQ